MNQLPALARVFAYLSILTVGGGMAAFPELKTLAVNVHKWLTLPQLIHLYGVGQMAPGPKMMMIVPIGQRVAGIAGAVGIPSQVTSASYATSKYATG
jgi:chromate transporter